MVCRKVTFRFVLSAVIVMAVGMAAPAGTVDGVAPFDTTLKYNGQIGTKKIVKLRGLPLSNIIVSAGAFSFTQIDPNTGANLQTFCLDPQFIVAKNTTVGYDVGDLSQAPLSGSHSVATLSPLQVSAIQQLWSNQITQPGLAPGALAGINGPAFQLAVWEIAWETTNTGYSIWDVSSGSFFADAGYNSPTTVINTANNMLGALSTGGTETALKALISATVQDQAVLGATVAPIPAAVLPGLALLAGVGYFHRARRHRGPVFDCA